MTDTNNDDDNNGWIWDQTEDTATITTRQVAEQGLPVLVVTHFADDHSWAFTCGVSEDENDVMIVAMETIINLDPTLSEIADLEPGWSAYRDAIGAPWEFEEDIDEDEED